ncbi:hypothetical protein [Streptomyces sp. 2112.2]|uniref:hypothetical protein n=1 Tax=Streptomyces sp. 2112.2 TaxID=1881024 RepID=UPI00115FA2B1|nr:hypothetical protein [Streptomyces sp. 2112.2]
MTTTVGVDALRVLDGRRVTLGPVLVCPPRATVEFLAPRGYCDWWPPQPSVRLVSSGHIRWPAPDVTLLDDRQAECGRSWIVPPLITVGQYTPIGDLYKAVQDSLHDHIAAAEAATKGRAVTSAQAPRHVSTLR